MDAEYNVLVMPASRFRSLFSTISFGIGTLYFLLMVDRDGDLFAHISIGDFHITFDSFSSYGEFDASCGKYWMSFEKNKLAFGRTE